MGSGDPYAWLAKADDAQLGQFAAELAETLPPDGLMIAGTHTTPPAIPGRIESGRSAYAVDQCWLRRLSTVQQTGTEAGHDDQHGGSAL